MPSLQVWRAIYSARKVRGAALRHNRRGFLSCLARDDGAKSDKTARLLLLLSGHNSPSTAVLCLSQAVTWPGRRGTGTWSGAGRASSPPCRRTRSLTATTSASRVGRECFPNLVFRLRMQPKNTSTEKVLILLMYKK